MSRTLDVRSEPVACSRCGGSLATSTMSFFTTEIICLDCSDDEEQAPGFAAAHAAEVAAVQSGNFRFEGVGLSPDDRAFLEARRLERFTRGKGQGWRWRVVDKRSGQTVTTLTADPDGRMPWVEVGHTFDGRPLSDFYFVRLKEEQPIR